MSLIIRFFVITLFLAGLLTVGILGTSTALTFVWPGYLVIGLAGIASVIAIFRRTKFSIPLWCIGCAFLVVGYLLLRAMNSPVAYFAREDGALLITCFIVYMVFLSMMDSSRWRKGLFWSIVFLLAFNMCMALFVQLIKGGEIWILPNYDRTFSERVGGVFNHPEHFAGFMALGIPFLCSALIFGHHSFWTKLFLATLCVFCFLAIIAAKSLLGFLAMLVGLGVLFSICGLLSWKKLAVSTRKSIIWGFAITSLVVATFLTFNFGRVGQLVDSKIMTREGQVSLPGSWSSSLEQFAEAPLAGTGSRTFYYFSRKFLPDNGGSAQFESEFVHNEYLQALADYGLIGLLLILVLVIAHVFNGAQFVLGYARFQTAKGTVLPKSTHLSLVAGSLAAIVTIAFLAFFDFVIHVPAIAVLATIFIGVLACPDPMSQALRSEEEDTYLPGGGVLFIGRGLAFGCGVALTFFAFIFSKSEWHLEMARVGFDNNQINTEQLQHLDQARRIDPDNPFAMSLTAHSYVGAIHSDMSAAERLAYLEKAEQFFQKAYEIYPQDVHSAVAHSVVLDALNRPIEAGAKLREAREWAPLYGNLMVAQGEHFLRKEDYGKAERSFRMAMDTTIFRDDSAIQTGLTTIAKWKGIDEPETQIVSADGTDPITPEPRIKDANVREIEISGEIGSAIDQSLQMLEEKLGAELVEPVAPNVEE